MLWTAWALIAVGAFSEAGFVLGPPSGLANGGDDRFEALVVDADGRLVVGGHSRSDARADAPRRAVLLRYTALGKLDTSFANNGSLLLPAQGDDRVLDLAIDSKGQIWASGMSAGAPAVWRVQPDGQGVERFVLSVLPDARGWRLKGKAHALALDSKGRVLVVGAAEGAIPRGWFGRAALCRWGWAPDIVCYTKATISFVGRLRPDGALDPKFGDGGYTVGNGARKSWYTGPHDELVDLVVLPNDQIIGVGWVAGPTYDEERGIVVQYTATGRVLRSRLGPKTSRAKGAKEVYYGASRDTEGRLLIAGFSFDPPEKHHICGLTERRKADLSVDTDYAGGFVVESPRALSGSDIEYLVAVREAPGGRIFAVGFTDDQWAYGDAVDRALLVSYRSDGTPDPAFASVRSSWIKGQSRFTGGRDDAFFDLSVTRSRVCAAGTSGGRGLVACYKLDGQLDAP